MLEIELTRRRGLDGHLTIRWPGQPPVAIEDERLLRSLDDDDEPDAVEAAWVTEIERRIVDRDAGRTGTESFGSVMAAITAQLAADRDPQDR